MEHLLDTKDAAGFLKVSEMTIRRWTNSGKLKCYRVGGKRARRFYISDLEQLLHDSKNNRLKPLGFGGQRVPDGSHMTHFYAGKEEAFGVSIPYLLEGIERGEALLAVMPPDKSTELIKNIERQRHPVGNWLKSGRLRVSAGMDSPEEMIRYLVGFAARANDFRVVGDMLWAVLKGWDLTTLSALEQAPNLMPPVENGLVLCQYSLKDFFGATIMMAAEWHRQTIYKGRLEKSPYYSHERREPGDHGTDAL
jgi:transcriptional repressor of dcmA and dcmR